MSESEELKCALDFQIGDIVQLLNEGSPGALGRIANIKLSRSKKGLVYDVWVASENRFYCMPHFALRFLSHAEK